MSSATASAQTASALLEPSEYSQYMLRNPAEILVVMRGLFAHVAQITVFFNEGKDMILTTLAAVAEDGVVLDYGANGEMNRKALDAQKHFCVTTLDKVRVQFILREFEKVELDGRSAFRARLPAEVLRLQRREFYRLVTPIVRPLTCSMPIALPDGSVHVHEAHVFDISGGGIGVSAPSEEIPFGPAMEFANCRVELPEVGFVTATVKIRGIFELTLRSGARMRRAGCEFVDLPGPMGTLIQRYIIKVERERKARESGMG